MEKAEENNDRSFKEFFYAAVGAKFLEGHTKEVLRWLKEDLPKEIDKFAVDSKLKARLKRNAKEINIAYETPDARDPQHAGLFVLWSPRQQYAAIKVIRKNLKTERVWMLMDFEHVATQGIDPILDMEEVIKIAPDFGQFVISVHSNPPNPLHSMDPIELGDDRVYKLLWMLRKTGFGKDGRRVYLIFERGGAKDPFARSVEVLKLCVEFLEKDVDPNMLPPEFYGIKGLIAGSEVRQMQIVRDHFYEPLKDLLEMSEEEWTFLSQTAIRKGKRPEVWKKAEFR